MGLNIGFNFVEESDRYCGKYDYKRKVILISIQDIIDSFIESYAEMGRSHSLGEYAKVIIAHELGHALDDQKIEKIMRNVHDHEVQVNNAKTLIELRWHLALQYRYCLHLEFRAWENVHRYANVNVTLAEKIKINDYKLKNENFKKIKEYFEKRMENKEKLNLSVA